MDFHPVVEVSEEVADFLAQQMADEAFHELQHETEFRSFPGIDVLERMKEELDREWEKIARLRDERKVEMGAPLLTFVGRELGRWLAFELDGWESDDEEFSEKRRLSRATFDEISGIAKKVIAERAAQAQEESR